MMTTKVRRYERRECDMYPPRYDATDRPDEWQVFTPGPDGAFYWCRRDGGTTDARNSPGQHLWNGARGGTAAVLCASDGYYAEVINGPGGPGTNLTIHVQRDGYGISRSLSGTVREGIELAEQIMAEGLRCSGTMRNGPRKAYTRCDKCGEFSYEQNEGDTCGAAR